MRKFLLSFMFLFLMVFVVSGVSYGWQGRMAGMADPYGLVSDESDFLIHAAKIAKGQGVKVYGSYRFTYTGVTDWNYDLNTLGLLSSSYSEKIDISGNELAHDTLLGVSFPLGAGRMGIFFTYSGMRGKYDGTNTYSDGDSYPYDLESGFDAPSIKLLYGLPVGSFKIGTEAQIAYRKEKQEYSEYYFSLGEFNINDSGEYNMIYMFPYDSSYWEALLKGSFEGKAGAIDLAFTIKGGVLFAGDNTWRWEQGSSWVQQDGDVKGWRLGSELWLRYPLSNTLTLPFLLRVDYQTKTRDGSGPGMGGVSGMDHNYKQERRDLAITVGSGVDKEISAGSRFAGGIYYSYLRGKDNLCDNRVGYGWQIDNYTFPDMSEHQMLLRLAGEHTLSPVVILHGGLSFFYGFVNIETDATRTGPGGYYISDGGSGDGYHSGIGASLGASIVLKQITLEPFINGGYQQFRVNWDGMRINTMGGGLEALRNEELTRDQWYVGGGLSILFGL